MKKVKKDHKSEFILTFEDNFEGNISKAQIIKLIDFLKYGVEKDFTLYPYVITDYEGDFESIDFNFYEVIEESEEEYQERIKQEQLEIKIAHERNEYKLYQKLKEKYER